MRSRLVKPVGAPVVIHLPQCASGCVALLILRKPQDEVGEGRVIFQVKGATVEEPRLDERTVHASLSLAGFSLQVVLPILNNLAHTFFTLHGQTNAYAFEKGDHCVTEVWQEGASPDRCKKPR